MLSFLNQYATNYFASQNGEEGIILEVIRRLDETFQIKAHGHAVEIGGNNGLYCSNTALLLRQHGWSGLFVEGEYGLYLESVKNWSGLGLPVRHQCCYVDEKNINAFVHNDCDLLSLDTDGLDYQIFRGLQAKPKIVIIEIDSSVPPGVLTREDGLGCTYQNTVNIGIEKGYFLLCHTGNLVFVREDFKHLFPEVKSKHPLIDSEFYFKRAWLKEVAA